MIEINTTLEAVRAEFSKTDNRNQNCENGELSCIFYKNEKCSPTKAKFKICAKCHRFQGFTSDNAVSYVFNRIVALAGLLISTFGLAGSGASGGGSAAGASGGSGGGGK